MTRDLITRASEYITADPELCHEIARQINERSGMNLTARQRELLDFIAAHIAKTRCAPTYTEMAEHMGLMSKSGINRLVVGLEERGVIRRLPDRARAIQIIGGN